MLTFNDVHQQFAAFFDSEKLRPFAYLVSKKLAEGHICLDIREAAHEIEDAEPAALEDDQFVGAGCPFILHNHKLYLQRYFSYETQILERLRGFVQDEPSEPFVNDRFIRTLFPADNTREADWQLVAAIMAVLNRFTIITGGPGTGKTTTVARILAMLYETNPDLKVALAAPTGKAAVRMAESLKTASGIPVGTRTKFDSLIPGTLHRLLKIQRNTPYFVFNEHNPLPYDVVIVDESSMIDAALFAKLLNAIGTSTRLILLGDKNQLASVEAGSLFGDLCDSEPVLSIPAPKAALINELTGQGRGLPAWSVDGAVKGLLAGHIIELKKSHRFRDYEGIGLFSKALIEGNAEVLQAFIDNADDEHVYVDTNYDQARFEKFIDGYLAYISEPNISSALKKLNDLRVLCAVREGDHGVHTVNRSIEKYLQQKKLVQPIQEFYEHRPVIINRNYYELNLYNGDVGIIRKDENGTLRAWFEDADGTPRSLLPGLIGDAETVYAMTIHKSQGSEYDKVLVILPDDPESPLLTSELLYTAVTRAKTSVLLQATESVIRQTATRRVKRASGIIERLQSNESGIHPG